MKKQNKKLRILTFCWGEPKLIGPYLNFTYALSNYIALKITFIKSIRYCNRSKFNCRDRITCAL